MSMNETDERRREPRIEVSWYIALYTERGIIEGEVKNITSDGVFVCCEEPLQLQKTLRMSISPPKMGAIEVSGRVVWSDFYGMDEDQSPICLGISFAEIAAEDRKRLIEAVRSHFGDNPKG
jgi:hypothetical protein